ncbi:hypothetical protein IB211_00121c [Intestinimonas butyriciproducens]|uniref:Uncharacterized protein n=1 Tax=Intestinimonas butyriciproducens TaxID=1297617 RepID=A0A0S2VZJ8_9FIRM|nr:hypothetical protein IB211_00121c [Intestinimonas butyriciproducens]
MFESQYLSFLPQAISCAVLSAAYFQGLLCSVSTVGELMNLRTLSAIPV